GWVSNISLILNLLFTIGILAAFGFTVTAAGIAALVLTVGMAVDTNVIIFERIKEELTRGKGYQNAVNDGYKRSYAPVLDAHVTTFLTAAILFIFGVASCFHGFDEGVECAGGRSYTVRFEQKPDVDKMRDGLKGVFGEYPIIKTVDREDQLNITTSYKIHETGNNVDSSVEQTL